MEIRDRIKELRRVRASDLIPDKRNWRKHPKHQSEALQGVLAEIGYADALLVRETPDGLVLVDGHLRAEITPDMEVPVLVLDVDEDEAAKILLTLDPLAAMAQVDTDALTALAGKYPFKTKGVNDMLEALANDYRALVPIGEPEIEPQDWPELPTGDRPPIGQMTFMVSRKQKEVIDSALAKAKTGKVDDPVNANSNGNALAAICESFMGS